LWYRAKSHSASHERVWECGTNSYSRPQIKVTGRLHASRALSPSK
jgi:hypothetical protein